MIDTHQAQNLRKTRILGPNMLNFDPFSLRKTLSCQNLEKLCLQKDSQIFSAFYGIFRFAPISTNAQGRYKEKTIYTSITVQ